MPQGRQPEATPIPSSMLVLYSLTEARLPIGACQSNQRLTPLPAAWYDDDVLHFS
jgi:hypothetical protein